MEGGRLRPGVHGFQGRLPRRESGAGGDTDALAKEAEVRKTRPVKAYGVLRRGRRRILLESPWRCSHCLWTFTRAVRGVFGFDTRAAVEAQTRIAFGKHRCCRHQPKPPPRPEYIVDESTGCWLWQKAKNDKGYGQIWSGGKVKYAHRVFYERERGVLNDQHEIDHLCRRHACVNPSHLEPVFHAENARRGKSTRLTRKDVETIRGLVRVGNISQAEAARRWKVASSHVSRIVSRKKWR